MSVAITLVVAEILFLAMSSRLSRELGWRRVEVVAVIFAIVAMIGVATAVIWQLAIWAGQPAPDFAIAPLAFVGALNVVPALRANALATGRAK